MDRDAALATLRDAASKWATELETYIIPNAAETDESDAANYQQELDGLNEALALFKTTVPDYCRCGAKNGDVDGPCVCENPEEGREL